VTHLGYDILLNLTDSRYRLSTIVAKRAVQLKKGLPSTLARDEYPVNRDGVSNNVVAVAVQELLLDKDIAWGETLPSNAELIRAFELDQQRDPLTYCITLTLPDQSASPGDLTDPLATTILLSNSKQDEAQSP
jgi:DNA-directed RNA polymerase subunit omega